MGIGRRIKEARNALNMTQEELAKILGVTKGAIANYENETSHPKEPIMYKMFDALKVDANYLFQDVVNIPRKTNDVTFAEYERIQQYRALDDTGRDHVDTVLQWETDRVKQAEASKAPVSRVINYYYRLASAGTGQIVFDMPPTRSIQIPDIPEYKKADYAIGVNGISMEPVYHDGDILLVEMTDHVDVGEIGIFLVNGQSYVKQRGRTELISLNAECDNVPLTPDSRCMGRVITSLPYDIVQ